MRRGIIFVLTFAVSWVLLGWYFTPNVLLWRDGGVGAYLTNRTGTNSVAGLVVMVSESYPSAYERCTNKYKAIGVVLTDGLPANTTNCVLHLGEVYVLMESNSYCTNGNLVFVSESQPGRVNASLATPPNGWGSTDHFYQLGTCAVTTNNVGNPGLLIKVSLR